jgi:hypothetical protein
MRFSSQRAVFSLLLALFFSIAIADVVNSGINVFTAAQVMIDLASHSWEWGTGAEALLELYNNELSVFGPDPFPNGQIPKADPSIFALAYAQQFIATNAQVLVANSAVGDPASLGVSCILLGQSDSTYIGAAERQADYLLNIAPRWSNGAISQRPDVAELWADNMAMSFPFCTSDQSSSLSVLSYFAPLMPPYLNQDERQRASLLTNTVFDQIRSGILCRSTKQRDPDGGDGHPVWPATRSPPDQRVPQLAAHHRPAVPGYGPLVHWQRLGWLWHGTGAHHATEMVRVV